MRRMHLSRKCILEVVGLNTEARTSQRVEHSADGCAATMNVQLNSFLASEAAPLLKVCYLQ